MEATLTPAHVSSKGAIIKEEEEEEIKQEIGLPEYQGDNYEEEREGEEEGKQ